MKLESSLSWIVGLLCLFLSLSSTAADISYIAGNDEMAIKFNHAATEVFTNGAGLETAIKVGEQALAQSDEKGRAGALRQLLATFYTFAGRYDKAAGMYPVFSHAAAVEALAKTNPRLRFIDAASAISAMARTRQAVFVNENHGAPITRLLPLELLPRLRAEGYKYLALETLNRSASSIALVDSDSNCISLVDKDLCRRGYGLDRVETGIYSHEPVYGELIRTALSLGFRLVAYDVFDAKDDDARDQGQASNLAKVFKGDPSGKMIVLGGFDHVAKEDANMAAVFKRMTNIDPLSVDQADLLGLDPKLWGPHSGVPRDRASVAFVGDMPLSSRPGAMDISVYRPPYSNDRATAKWLTLDGARQPVAMPRLCNAYPCLLSARREGEPESVPEDRLYLDRRGSAFLYLSPGHYVLTAATEQGHSATSLVVTKH
jgi:hypothetical protein